MGQYYRGGKLISAETIHLHSSITLDGSTETTLAAQSGPVTADTITVVSDSVEDDVLKDDTPATPDTPATKRTLALTLGGSVSTGDVIDLGIAANHYTYTITGLESGAGDLFDAVVTSAAADPSFDVTTNGTELDLQAKTAGTAANAITVTWAWTTGSGTASIANTNGAALIPGDPIVPGVAGTGAHTVMVEYLDTDGKSARETLTLDGTSPVASEGSARWIQRVTIVTAGSNGLGGTLTAKIGDTVCLTIDAGDVQTESTAYVVPAGRQMRLTGILATASAAARVRIRASYDPETGTVFEGPKLAVADFIAATQPALISLPYACGPFPAGSFVAVTAQASNGVVVSASVDAFLEPAGY